MPRLRAAKTKEEAAAVPAGESVQIVLGEEVEVAPEKKDEPKEQVLKTEPRPEPKAIEPEPRADEPDVGALQKQIEALKLAEKAANDRLTAEQQRSEQARQEAQQLRTESTKHQEDAVQAQYDAIVNALGGAQGEAESAKRELKAAKLNGDTEAEVEAMDRLAAARADISRFSDGKAAIEARQEAIKTAPKVEQKNSDPFEQAIAQLPDSGKNWMRSHPEYMTDQRKNAKIQAFHWDVLDEGHRPFTDGYFESMEIKLGLREKPKPKVEDEVEVEVEPAKPQRTVVTQAPPTREVPSAGTGRPQSSKVTLTPEEREHARISGVDEVTYAKGVLERENRKRNGQWGESR